MGATRAHKNRKVRQEALREQLTTHGHVQHVIEICDELNDLNTQLDATEVNRKKIVIDTKLKLINKYLPDLKAVEVTGEAGDDLVITTIERKIV